MRKLVLFALLLVAALASAPLGSATPASDQYSIAIHVSSSYLISANGHTTQMLDVTIDGKKYRLAADFNGNLLALGDYKAKLTKDDHRTPYESDQVYEFQFPDNKTRKFFVYGQFE